MRPMTRAAFAAIMVAMAVAAAAQEPQKAADGPDIVVTAQKDVDEEVHDFVRALTQAPISGQLSRFETLAACPAVVGLSAERRSAIVRRMRRVATGVGVPLAKENCTANILIIVTRDKKSFVEALARRYPYYFGELSRTQIRDLADQPGPAVAWQLAGPQLDADGLEMPIDQDTGAYVNKTTRIGSRITFAARPQFGAAVVVVEQQALVGLTTTQLADYAAMRGYARTDPARLKDSSVSTILKVLDAPADSAVPITLTSWDAGFLRGLYASPVNLRTAAQRSAIGQELKKSLKPADEPGK